MPVPGASNIETLHKSRSVRLYSTLLPQTPGRRLGRRLASPLHGTLTPGRISVGRSPFGRTGVSLSLTESSQNSLPRTAFGQMGTAGHLTFGRFDRSGVGDNLLFLTVLLLQVVLAHPPASLASLVKRPRQERIQVLGYSIFEVGDFALALL